MDGLVSWFKSHGGSIDTSAMGFTYFPNAGRGAAALTDIPEGHTLFTIPRALTLSARTSSLPTLLGSTAWKVNRLDKGWSGLILCMMWEEARGKESAWCEYLASLPTTFDTPIFWDDKELEELTGTAVIEKIGKADAEQDYHGKVVPTIQSRPDIFPPALHAQFYSMERYHIMGSRILSRSFQVEKWQSQDVEAVGEDGEDADGNVANTSVGSAMDVDPDPSLPVDGVEHGNDNDSDSGDADADEDEDDPSDVALVPMADMLNARYGSENAKLFYEEKELKMVSTKPISAGEQIWNTYGDPPNSVLLRRYGHVDLITPYGSPVDIVEIRADLVVGALSQQTSPSDSTRERIDWWLEEGGDDVFVLEADLDLPEVVFSLVRLLLLPQDEWEKARDKGKLPKPKIDLEILLIATKVIKCRLQDYATNILDDEALLADPENLTLNKKQAVIVRLGEKKLLHGALEKLQAMEQTLRTQAPGGKSRKRRGVEEILAAGKSKKSKR